MIIAPIFSKIMNKIKMNSTEIHSIPLSSIAINRTSIDKIAIVIHQKFSYINTAINRFDYR